MGIIQKFEADVNGLFKREERVDFSWVVDGRTIQCKRAWGFRQQLLDISNLIGMEIDETVTINMIALGVCSVNVARVVVDERELTQDQVDDLLGYMDRAREKINHLKEGGSYRLFRIKEEYTKREGGTRGLDNPAIDNSDRTRDLLDSSNTKLREPIPDKQTVDEKNADEHEPTSEELQAARTIKKVWMEKAGMDALMGRETTITTLMRAMIELYPDD